jgi:hypothetical protein
MIGKLFSQLVPDSTLTCIGLVIFLLSFIAVFIQVYGLRGQREYYEQLGKLPLEGNQNEK